MCNPIEDSDDAGELSEQYVAQFYGVEHTDGVRLEDRAADPCEAVRRDSNAARGGWRPTNPNR